MSNYSPITQPASLDYLDSQQPHQYGSPNKAPVQPVTYTLVDTTETSRQLGFITTVIYSKCIEHPNYQKDCPEIDSISVRLQEMVASYIEHHVSYSMSNLGFEYFLQDFLPTCAKYLMSQPQVMSYLGTQFALVCQATVKSLQPALSYLTNVGYEVTEVESAIIVPEKKSLFTITGGPDSEFWDGSVPPETV